MFINIIKEYISIPSLIVKVLYKNFIQKKHFFESFYQYGENKQQHVIFIMPLDGVKKDKLIFFIHGGGWKNGNATVFKFVGYFFAKLGYASIIAGYRLVPKYHFPCQIDDVFESLKYGIEISKKNNAYNNKILIIGQSVGSQLGTLLAFNEIFRRHIVGIISISGPLNFDACKNNYIKKLISNFIGDIKNYNKANPINYLIKYGKNRSQPFLCIHGDKDPTVEKENSISFVEKANEISQGKAKLIIIKKGLHSNLNRIFLGELKQAKEMLTWIEKI